ncbi:ATP-dependent DNA helicase RecG [Brevibacterium marinum]|uniref:Probable DNA 3'-5' helicase RecG n=1 Tax=Brevibacterium marinum TaxID=418643 RepID=A0A846S1C2_9MICO|nr:ATP-dependent DNA helicase RecG [Brevibacterium marinum]NJC56858.1 ATP-dependent DNA helicase RecG [Brevibacterium marinum]
MSARLDDYFTARDRGALKKRGITSVADLFRFFPRRFLIPGEKTPLGGLPLGETAILQAEVISVDTRRMQKRRGTITDVVVHDGRQSMKIAFFNQRWLDNKLVPGLTVVFAGKVEEYRGQLTLNSPTWLNRDEHDEKWTPEDLNSPFPVYPRVKGIAQTRLWKAVKVLLDVADPEEFEDPIPATMREHLDLPDLRTALNDMHRPRSAEATNRAKQRWKWEEALALQTELVSRKADYAQLEATPLLKVGDRCERFDRDLPFALTPSQVTVGEEIAHDLGQNTAMHRLLHGDVGSGKTVVALRAMLKAVDSDSQAAMLAPTEVLASQHFDSIERLLGDQMALSPLLSGDDQVRVALLTGSMPARERKQLALDLATGQIDIVVGTHALMSDSTMFDELGLIVVDEQHRFGVEQREALRAKAGTRVPHTLVMSATPIPRTVAMTVFADLDVSTLKEMPAGGKDITTHTVSLADHPQWLGRVHELLAQTADRGEGGFVVAPRIESSDVEDPETEKVEHRIGVEELKEKMENAEELSSLTIGLLHGKMPTAEKDRIMKDFVTGAIDALVATTVIEVGVDVPRATMMIIHEAERFGIAQLHQLRGRVGRDGRPASCFLISNRPETDESFDRLRAVAGTLDGFELAEYDLDNRGEGDVLGASQWGGSSLHHLAILRDAAIVEAAREYAEKIIAVDPGLRSLPALRRFINRVLPAESAHFIEAS